MLYRDEDGIRVMHNHDWVTTEEAEESVTQECLECPTRRRLRRVVVETVIEQTEWLDTGELEEGA